MAAELENDQRENVRKLAQALDVSARMVYATLVRMAKLSKKRFRRCEAAEAMTAVIL